MERVGGLEGRAWLEAGWGGGGGEGRRKVGGGRPRTDTEPNRQ